MFYGMNHGLRWMWLGECDLLGSETKSYISRLQGLADAATEASFAKSLPACPAFACSDLRRHQLAFHCGEIHDAARGYSAR